MNPLSLHRLSIRLIFYWLILSVSGLAIAPLIASTLLPFFNYVLTGMSKDYTTTLQIKNQNSNPMVEIVAETSRPIKVTYNLYIRPGETFTASIHVLHIMVPIIILFTILCTFPIEHRMDRIKLLLLGIPICIIILGITIPALLDGHIEMQLFKLMQSSGGSRDKHLLLDWVVFVEMGGIWLLPIIGAIFCRMAVKEINYLSQYFNGQTSPVKTTKKQNSKQKTKC